MTTPIEPVFVQYEGFGDVDRGPTAGVRVAVKLSGLPNCIQDQAKDIWNYFTHNYEDDWQTYRIVSAERGILTVDVYTKWGDGYPSDVPGEPLYSPRTRT